MKFIKTFDTVHSEESTHENSIWYHSAYRMTEGTNVCYITLVRLWRQHDDQHDYYHLTSVTPSVTKIGTFLCSGDISVIAIDYFLTTPSEAALHVSRSSAKTIFMSR